VETGCGGRNGGTQFMEKFSMSEYGFVALVQDTGGNTSGLQFNEIAESARAKTNAALSARNKYHTSGCIMTRAIAALL
jgi:hypothetical protein